MDPFHKPLPNGGFMTSNPTLDPRYPQGSYYVSVGWGSGHNTFIFGSDGSLLPSNGLNNVIQGSQNLLIQGLVNRNGGK